jgi:aminopeptidase YwaD
MLYQRTFRRLLIAFLLLAPSAVAQRPVSERRTADEERLRAHVTRLASPEMEGRRTGTPGAQAAARYVEAEFKRLGLAPGGDRKGSRENFYLQEFPYVSAVELGKQNGMVLTGDDDGTPLVLRVGEDWMPLGFGANAKVERARVAFVGYGITASELNHDDYREGRARGSVALAFAGTPDGDNPHGQFTRAGELRFKAAAARAAGARALLLVAREENLKDDKLARLAYDNAGDAGLPVAVISRQAAARLLGLENAAQLAEREKDWRNFTPSARLAGTNVSLTTDVVRRNAPASNVVGVIEGSDPKLKEEVIVVGAHYDHLGRGGQGSLAQREGEVHHGADDNASGTAALLEIARLLTLNRSKVRRTVVLIAFGGEEEGLIGSKFYAEHPARPLAQTVAMLNLDMVGRMREDSLTVGGVGTASEWREVLEAANKAYDVAVFPQGEAATVVAEARTKDEAPIIVTGSDGRVAVSATPRRPLKLRLNEDGFGPSDHASFYARQVPVLFFFTGTHEDYHKPSDTADRVNYAGLARVTDFVRDILSDLHARDARPTFTRARVETQGRATGFRVYLGTVPSYGESTDGMKLDGVREGSPAEAAGLKAGDRIVKLAGRDVRNVYDYTQALSEMKAGQEYEVVIVRAGQRLTLKLTPAARR